MKKLPALTFVACSLLLFSACKEKNKDKFDRAALLNNLYSELITPSFNQLKISADGLNTKANSFNTNPNLQTLDSLKVALLNTYIVFQSVEVYDLTPSSGLRNNLNSFPPDTNQINSNILSGSYDLNTANNIRAKGFPALDYLLFGKNAIEVTTLFSTDVNANKRKQYLLDVVNEIKTKSETASTAWSGYQQTFVNASGTDVGSSVGMLVNDLSFSTERCRRERVGNSLGYIGIISSGNVSANTLEAYYSNYSKQLLIENLTALKKVYSGSNGIGFDDYLNSINADYNGQPLATEISEQFDRTISIAENIPVDFSTALTSHQAQMESLFIELKRLTVLLKVDMSSQLGVIINYSDNDGD
jgi:predicted lipoprotein